MFHLERSIDVSLVFLRIMVGLVFLSSGYRDVKNPGTRSKSIGLPERFALLLGIAEFAGGAAIVVGLLTQLAAIGLLLVMAVQYRKRSSFGRPAFGAVTASDGIMISSAHRCLPSFYAPTAAA
jgi:putative oxidoreductase